MFMEKRSSNKEEFRESPAFNPRVVSDSFQNSIFGTNIVYQSVMSSTNSRLKGLADGGAPEGAVAIADEQSAGRGRMGRQWISKKNKNLLFSVLLRPKLPPHRLFVLTMIFALAGIDAVEQVSGLRAMIKWPNDIYIGRKKLGGILTEFSVIGKATQYVVLGMGLNVNWNPPAENVLLYPSSSIFAETRKNTSREALLIFLLKAFEKYYHKVMFHEDGVDQCYEKWNKRSMITQKQVLVETGRETLSGKAHGIDRDGALILMGDDGQERKILCGDVSVKALHPIK